MAKKPKREKIEDKNPKLDIFYELAQVDNKARAFFDDLNEDEQNKFKKGLYPLMRWTSTVQDNPLIEQYYLMSANDANRYFFSLSKHPKLQWLLMTTISPIKQRRRHEWIAMKGSSNKRVNLLSSLYPNEGREEMELLAELLSEDELKQQLKELGWEDKRIKEALK